MKWLAVGVTFFILYVVYLANTGTPNFFDDMVRSVRHGDKIGHFLLMGSLALVVNLAMGREACRRWTIGRWVLGGTAIVAVFVTLEECSQMFIATRTFNPLDLLADYLGMGAANAFASWHFKRSENSSQPATEN